MLVRRRALQLQSAQCVSVRLLRPSYILAGSTSSPFPFPFPFPSPAPPFSPFFLPESRCPVSLRFFALIPLLRPGQVRRRADSDQTGVLFPPRGSHKALAVLLSNLDREGV